LATYSNFHQPHDLNMFFGLAHALRWLTGAYRNASRPTTREVLST
jgi:hypothetical protein